MHHRRCYATSIKTRIETLFARALSVCVASCYATSIKTRIETPHSYPLDSCQLDVVMLLPLKQGLKPRQKNKVRIIPHCCYATSIKTRIET